VETTDPIGQKFQNILDYMAAGPVALSQTIVNAFIAAWQANAEALLKNTLATDVTISRYTAADVVIGTTPTVIKLVSVAGGVAGNSLPGPVASVTTKYTALKGQHGRGRYYGGSVPISFCTPAVDPNTLNAGALAAYVNYNLGLLAPLAAGGVNWALAVSLRPAPPLTLVTNAALVTILQTEQPLGTVRRRREGRGI
jgi:hypothetical protein